MWPPLNRASDHQWRSFSEIVINWPLRRVSAPTIRSTHTHTRSHLPRNPFHLAAGSMSSTFGKFPASTFQFLLCALRYKCKMKSKRTVFHLFPRGTEIGRDEDEEWQEKKKLINPKFQQRIFVNAFHCFNIICTICIDETEKLFQSIWDRMQRTIR